MQQLQHQHQQRSGWRSRAGNGPNSYCCNSKAAQRRSVAARRTPSVVAAAASVEQEVSSSDVDHLKMIAGDATQIIGNTPMVRWWGCGWCCNTATATTPFLCCSCMHASLPQHMCCAHTHSLQVYLNSVTKQGCYARIACKLELMQPCCR